jgi:hypothetical protein
LLTVLEASICSASLNEVEGSEAEGSLVEGSRSRELILLGFNEKQPAAAGLAAA